MGYYECMQYLFPYSEATHKNVFGVDLTLYGKNVPTNNLLLEETEVGMLQEFYDDVSTHTVSLPLSNDSRF